MIEQPSRQVNWSSGAVPDLPDLPGWPPDDFNNKNNHSIVVRVDFDQASFLFTGDLEEPSIERLVERYGPAMLNVDVHQVGHHGSRNGTTLSLVGAMSLDIAVISVGPHDDHRPFTAWQHGHPRRDAVEHLKAGITRTRAPKTVRIASAQQIFYTEQMLDAIYATGWDGTVRVRATAAGDYVVDTEH